MTSAMRHPGAPSMPVVAFDFDGTLTCRDSFVAYIAWRQSLPRLALGVSALIPALASYLADRDRAALGIATARRFLGGLTLEALEIEASRFHAARFDRLLRPDALSCWRDWRARGARLLIVTAAPEFLVAPFAKTLGADALIASRLAFDAAGRFTGQRDGAHCRGPEKVNRLRAALGAEVRLTAAYGDTDGDREMLAMAEFPGYRVFSARP